MSRTTPTAAEICKAIEVLFGLQTRVGENGLLFSAIDGKNYVDFREAAPFVLDVLYERWNDLALYLKEEHVLNLAREYVRLCEARSVSHRERHGL